MKRSFTLTIFVWVLVLVLGTFQAVANGANPRLFEGAPQINPPSIIGNYPSTPFLFYIPTLGERPMQWKADGLPQGLVLDEKTGIIKGQVSRNGVYKVKLVAENKSGKDEKELLINIGDALALTPPMGWSSWNTFGRHLTGELIKEVADAMVANGMRDLGYAYINIDDFWQLAERGADGHMQVDKEKFPDGIKPIADYLHERGFKLGIYSDAADKTCGGVCGSYGHEVTDANDFASWGVDLLKYDYCNAPDGRQDAMERYTVMGKALRATGRSIVFSICEWGQREPWKWAKSVGGHYWRTTGDIGDHWSNAVTGPGWGVMEITDINGKLDNYAGPGGWNDPDMLIVGISGKSMSIADAKSGCSDEQYRSHMSLWCMMASPLLSGNDVRDMTSVTLETLTNPEIIAINQDVLGRQAERVIRHDKYDVWAKPLSDGSVAVMCLNRFDEPVTVHLNDKTIPGVTTNTGIRDVWLHKELGKFPQGMNVELGAYQCKVFIFKK